MLAENPAERGGGRRNPDGFRGRQRSCAEINATDVKGFYLIIVLISHCLQNKQSVKFSINSAFFIEMCYNKCKKIIKSNKKACT